jgi:ribokinase
VSAANGKLTPMDVTSRTDVIASANALLVQLETPLETVAAAIEIARQAGVRTILDPAPAPTSELPAVLRSVDLISPNQTEAEAMTAVSVIDLDSAERAAQMLKQRGAREVVMKLGELGALVCGIDGRVDHVAATRVDVVDTTAAGDAFTAGLAVALSEGRSLADAARFGCAAGSLACTVFGAQQAMPSRVAVDEFLKRAR